MRWIVGVLLGVPLLLVLLLLLLLGTAPGSRFLLGVAKQQVPGLSLADVSGRIGSPLSLSGVRYAAEGIEFVAERAVLRWRPGALLRGQLAITELAVEQVTLTLSASAETADEPTEPTPVSLPALPIDIEIKKLQLVDVRLVDETGALVLELDDAALAGQWTSQELALQVEALALRTPVLELAARGTVALEPGAGVLADTGLRSQLDYRLTLSDSPWAPLAGALTTRGPLKQLAVAHDLEAPYASTLTGELRGLPDIPGFALELEIDGLDPAQVRSDWPEGDIAAGLAAEGTIDSWRLDLTGRGATLERWRGELAGRLSGSQTAMAIESLEASTSFGELTAAGSLGWAEALAAELELELSNFNPVEFAAGWPGAIDATVDLRGRWTQPDDLRTLALRLEPLRLGGELREVPLSGELDLAVADGELRVTEGAHLRWGTNDVLLNGSLDQSGRGTLKLIPTFDDLALIPGVAASGTLGGSIELSGSLEEPRIDGELRLVDFKLDAIRLAGAEVGWSLALDPSSRQRLSVRLDALAAEGQKLDQVRVDLDGQLADHQLDLSFVQGDATLALGFNGAVTALPEGNDWFQQLDRWWRDGGSYRWSETAVEVVPATGAAWVLEAGGSGVVASAEQRLVRTCFAPRPSAAPAAATAPAASQAPVSGQSSGLACLSASRDQAGAVDLAYELEALPLALLDPWLPSTQSLSGRLEGSGELRLPDPALPAFAGQAELRLSRLLFRLQGYDLSDPEHRARVLAAEEGTLKLTSDGQSAQIALALPLTVFDYLQSKEEEASGAEELPALVDAALSLDLAATSWDQVGLSGAAGASLDSLGFLSALHPEITSAGGELRGDLELGGVIAEPALNGSLRWLDGHLSLLTPGIELRDIELAVTPVAGTGTSFDLTARLNTGPGFLNLDGTIDLEPAGEPTPGESVAAEQASGPRAALRLTGERALLADTPEVRLLASPTIFLRYQPERLTVRGAIEVPEANVTLQQFPPSAVVSSPDAVIVAETAEREPEEALAVDAELNLRLADEVRFSGFGLETRMTGELAVRQRPGRPVTGRGEIALQDGQFRAYGQNLAIERGVALWTNSPIAEPGIDLRAYRLPRPDIKVGVLARGPLSEPRTELYSEPSLTESDQLSYLVLGRPLENNSSSEQSLLSQAALALGIRGGNFLTSQFGDKLGVDEIGIQSEAGAGTDQAAFVVGKYLSPSIYVSYGVGLLDAVSRLKLEYFLSRHWTLQTESSTLSSGGDLIYQIERK